MLKTYFTVLATAGLTACGQVAEPECVPAKNAGAKIMLAQQEFKTLENNPDRFMRVYDGQAKALKIGQLLRESCVDASALDRGHRSSAAQMQNRVNNALTRIDQSIQKSGFDVKRVALVK